MYKKGRRKAENILKISYDSQQRYVLEREHVLDCMIMPSNCFIYLAHSILPCQRGNTIKFYFLALLYMDFFGFDLVTGI